MSDVPERYVAAAHKIQTGIAFLMGIGQGKFTEPKHLRVGIDLRAADACGLAKLLIAKGIFTEDEYAEAMALAAEEEAARIEEECKDAIGGPATLS